VTARDAFGLYITLMACVYLFGLNAAMELNEIPDFQKHIADEIRMSLMPEEELVSPSTCEVSAQYGHLARELSRDLIMLR
jgi:hypothetical protein